MTDTPKEKPEEVTSVRAVRSRIDSLTRSKPDWTGREVQPPTREAADVAERAYRSVFSKDFAPDRIIASGEGGIAFCFFRGDAYADMEFLNSGELLACTLDRASGATEIWEFSMGTIADTSARIKRFLAEHATCSI